MWRKNAKYSLVARLISVKTGNLLSIPRNPNGIIIGRLLLCDLKINGSDVSSRHCRMVILYSDGKEYVTVVDMLLNGLFVNGEKLGLNGKRVLQSGDKLEFAKAGGVYIFRYIRDAEAETKATFFDDYILGDQLGLGHYAVVKEARERATGEVVAVKIFHPKKQLLNQESDQNDQRLDQEMELLLLICHPNIVKFKGRYVEPISDTAVTNYLVLEKMNLGELFQRIINKGKLGQLETREIFKQILSGLHYLHTNHIIHRDIKPENILLDITPTTHPDQRPHGPWDEGELDVKVKIADFGLAKFIGELQFTHTLCGTPAYVAPEVLTKNRNYTTKVDVWLAGVLLYVCLCGFPPFSEELAPPSMREQITSGRFNFYSPYWDEIHDYALDVIAKMLVVDSDSRYTVEDVQHHAWFADDLELDESQLQIPSSLEMSQTQSETSQGDSHGRRIATRHDSVPITLKERAESLISANN